MTTWRLVVLAACLGGCVRYGKSTMRPGGNVSLPTKPSAGAAIVGTVLCATGAATDTSKVGQPPCTKTDPKTDAAQPAPLPAKKP